MDGRGQRGLGRVVPAGQGGKDLVQTLGDPVEDNHLRPTLASPGDLALTSDPNSPELK